MPTRTDATGAREHCGRGRRGVLAEAGLGERRDRAVAVRDTVPGLDGSWLPFAVRPPEFTAHALPAPKEPR